MLDRKHLEIFIEQTILFPEPFVLLLHIVVVVFILNYSIDKFARLTHPILALAAALDTFAAPLPIASKLSFHRLDSRLEATDVTLKTAPDLPGVFAGLSLGRNHAHWHQIA